MKPNYTFLSKSTAKPGKLQDLVRIACQPPEAMREHVKGLIAYQVSVDEARNTVAVWTTFDKKESLYDYLASDIGQANHGDAAEMEEIIETFEMFDMTPVAGFLPS